MAITAEVRLIFNTSAKGRRKNSSSHRNGIPNTTRRWNSSERTRAVSRAGNSFRFMASVPEQDGAGGFPGYEYPIAPGWPLTAAFHVRHGCLNAFAAGQFHVVRRDVTQVGNIVHRTAAPVVLAVRFVRGEVDLLRTQGYQCCGAFRRGGHAAIDKYW